MCGSCARTPRMAGRSGVLLQPVDRQVAWHCLRPPGQWVLSPSLSALGTPWSSALADSGRRRFGRHPFGLVRSMLRSCGSSGAGPRQPRTVATPTIRRGPAGPMCAAGVRYPMSVARELRGQGERPRPVQEAVCGQVAGGEEEAAMDGGDGDRAPVVGEDGLPDLRGSCRRRQASSRRAVPQWSRPLHPG